MVATFTGLTVLSVLSINNTITVNTLPVTGSVGKTLLVGGTFTGNIPTGITATWTGGGSASPTGFAVVGSTWSAMVTLPTAGTYALTVHATGPNTATSAPSSNIVTAVEAFAITSLQGSAFINATIPISGTYAGGIPSAATGRWSFGAIDAQLSAFSASSGTWSASIVVLSTAGTFTVIVTPQGPNTTASAPSSAIVVSSSSPLLFFDDFHGTTLGELATNWFFNQNGYSGDQYATFYAQIDPTNTPSGLNPYTTGPNGLSFIADSTHGNPNVNGLPWYTGLLRSKFTRLYGYFEYTTAMPLSPGSVNGANWNYTLVPSGNAEMDLVEHFGNLVMQTIWDGSAHNPTVNTTVADITQFHIYSLDWNASTTTMYLDGVQKLQIATPANSKTNPMALILSINIGNDGTPATDGTALPAFMTVMNVSVWTNKGMRDTFNPTPKSGLTWNHSPLTWAFATPASAATQGLGTVSNTISNAAQRTAVRAGMNGWAALCGVVLSEIGTPGSADIQVGYGDLGGLLGQADWNYNPSTNKFNFALIRAEDPVLAPLSTDSTGHLTYTGRVAWLQQVIEHEMGVILGLAEGTNTLSVLNHTLGTTNRLPNLDDINAAISIYGVP